MNLSSPVVAKQKRLRTKPKRIKYPTKVTLYQVKNYAKVKAWMSQRRASNGSEGFDSLHSYEPDPTEVAHHP